MCLCASKKIFLRQLSSGWIFFFRFFSIKKFVRCNHKPTIIYKKCKQVLVSRDLTLLLIHFHDQAKRNQYQFNRIAIPFTNTVSSHVYIKLAVYVCVYKYASLMVTMTSTQLFSRQNKPWFARFNTRIRSNVFWFDGVHACCAHLFVFILVCVCAPPSIHRFVCWLRWCVW